MDKKSQFLYRFRAFFVNSNSIPISFFFQFQLLVQFLELSQELSYRIRVLSRILNILFSVRLIYDGFPRGDEAELMRPFGMCHPGRPNTLTQCWGTARPTVCDAGPTLAQHWVIVLCLLGTRETLCWPTGQDVHPMLV